MTDDSFTAVQYGIGPIGSRIATAAHHTGFEFIGAVDVDPDKVGHDLGTVAGFDDEVGVTITDDSAEALATEPDIVFHSTVSSIETAAPQLVEAMAAGANVISTTEELAYPWWRAPELSNDLDETAIENGVTLLGTGINPGFVMDALPAVLSTPMETVESVTVKRVQDAGQRRKPLQKKVGAGIPVDTFETEAGHVGSTESVAMLADALEFDLDEITESIEPVVAEERIETDYLTVEPEAVAGTHQVAHGMVNGDAVLTLDLQMYVGADEPRDEIVFESKPKISVTVDGGYHGDIGTSAVVTNVTPTVVAAEAGFTSMAGMMPSFTRTARRE